MNQCIFSTASSWHLCESSLSVTLWTSLVPNDQSHWVMWVLNTIARWETHEINQSVIIFQVLMFHPAQVLPGESWVFPFIEKDIFHRLLGGKWQKWHNLPLCSLLNISLCNGALSEEPCRSVTPQHIDVSVGMRGSGIRQAKLVCKTNFIHTRNSKYLTKTCKIKLI